MRFKLFKALLIGIQMLVMANLAMGQPALQPGDTALAFTLPDTNGNPVSMSDFNAKILVLNFFATWCGPCRIEAPQLQDSIWQRYRQQEVVVLGMDFMEELQPLRDFVNEFRLTYPMARDTAGAVFKGYGFRGFPSNVIVDRSGKIAFIEEGYDIPALRHVIDSLLAVTALPPDAQPAAVHPRLITLHTAYPNPFNGRIKIEFSLTQAGSVVLAIYDITGNQVLVSKRAYSAGRHNLALNLNRFASGFYFYALKTAGQRVVGKLILSK